MRIGKSICLEVGNLINGNGSRIENVNIGIKEGMIIEVSNEKLTRNYDKVYDLSEGFVMPGLIDAHVHVKYGIRQDTVSRSDEYQSIRGLVNAQKALHAGVTSLGDAGALRNIAFAVRNTISDGIAVGPRMFVSR